MKRNKRWTKRNKRVVEQATRHHNQNWSNVEQPRGNRGSVLSETTASEQRHLHQEEKIFNISKTFSSFYNIYERIATLLLTLGITGRFLQAYALSGRPRIFVQGGIPEKTRCWVFGAELEIFKWILKAISKFLYGLWNWTKARQGDCPQKYIFGSASVCTSMYIMLSLLESVHATCMLIHTSLILRS